MSEMNQFDFEAYDAAESEAREALLNDLSLNALALSAHLEDRVDVLLQEAECLLDQITAADE